MFSSLYAEVAKLADALDSGSSARKGVRVQIPPSAPHQPVLAPRVFHRVSPISNGPTLPCVQSSAGAMSSSLPSVRVNAENNILMTFGPRAPRMGYSVICPAVELKILGCLVTEGSMRLQRC